MSTSTFFINVDSSRLSPSQVTGIRVALGVAGLLAVILGISILVWPGATLALVAWLFGIYFLVVGILRIVKGFSGHSEGTSYRVFSIILGVLLILGGVYILLNPVFGVAVLAAAIGITWIVEGIASLVESAPDSSRWFGVLYGVVSIVAGVIVLFVPVQSAAALLVFVAVLAIVAGVVEIVQAITFGRAAKRAGIA
jgi:uncharacterized membrane protein HdeD (DUF308 family)